MERLVALIKEEGDWNRQPIYGAGSAAGASRIDAEEILRAVPEVSPAMVIVLHIVPRQHSGPHDGGHTPPHDRRHPQPGDSEAPGRRR